MPQASRRLGSMIALTIAAALPLTLSAQVVQPESVGLSSERLQRIDDLVDRFIDSDRLPGR